ncbi:TIGR00269 family protein [Thermoplasma sp.]|uniref:TIGR00269 family protein n=1 Tax=Thermoplasma sp. TaxID=1973142 RepID=UPI00128845B4|nr:TIGR00269 family protein [Thermoplasma sp.]KAA8922940.1 MAG: TIGR00269 family protein [Thermoplasma sp.]
MRCSKCNAEAIYFASYNGLYLCREHFNEMVEKRVKSEIRKQIDLKKPMVRISVAISGGKDSSVTLYLLHKILSNRRNVKLAAFTVDEGINGYRPAGLDSAIRLANMLGVEHSIIRFRDSFGMTLDSIVSSDPNRIPCSYCGPLRRKLINEMAEQQNADYVALGLNLDDYSQSILMNVAKGDFDRFMRMSPQKDIKDGLVRRIAPLRSVPEKEVVIYAVANGIPFDSSWCPYYSRAQRNIFREVINRLSEYNPSTKFSILKFFERARSHEAEKTKILGRCKICGAPTENDICSACAAIESLRKEGKGEEYDISFR